MDILVIFLLLALIVFLNKKEAPADTSPSTTPPAASAGYQIGDYQYLVVQIGGDRRRADRLICYEQRQLPGLSREEAITRASERLISDNR